ncbi:MAG: hypothetical protein ACRDRO_14215 [Pseudonocardiaceae bacterium]
MPRVRLGGHDQTNPRHADTTPGETNQPNQAGTTMFTCDLRGGYGDARWPACGQFSD